jgi:hypothetical protein
VRDADRPEVERIAALHTLRGERDRRCEIARALVPVLNEPLLWLGSEVHAVLARLDDTLALGVNDHGLIAASPERADVLSLVPFSGTVGYRSWLAVGEATRVVGVASRASAHVVNLGGGTLGVVSDGNACVIDAPHLLDVNAAPLR